MGRESFGSRLGSILVIAGSAVGLGNIWRFPNMVGQNGGAAFIAIYIICVVLICLPIMVAALAIGRKSQANALGAFHKLAPKSKVWKHVGIIYIIIPTLILSYYCVIGGWTVEYFIRSVRLDFAKDVTPELLSSSFGGFTTATAKPLIMMTIFLLATAGIVIGGVQKGIERSSKVMMPVLFLIMILMAVRSLTLPGAGAGITYLFKPDFSKVTPSVVLAAMGQAFFSLSIGAGVLITYGSYIKKEDNLMTSAGTIAFFDLLFALVSGCAVLPAVFAYGMDVTEGTGLVFETLPMVFSQMPLGSFVAIFFFLALILAALTSSISQFEVPVSFLVEETHMSRRNASIIVFLIAFLIGTVCSLSFGKLSGWHIAGMNFFSFLDYLAANFLLPLGGLVAVIFMGWYLGKDSFKDELTSKGRIHMSPVMVDIFYALVKYLAPVAILVIFITDLI